jgi:glycosyltransferase involved in cell wall biosynthesis
MPLDIVLAAHGVAFDGRDRDQRALGGAEGAFVDLAEALAVRGHAVTALTDSEAHANHRGVAWRPLEQAPAAADLYLASRAARLLSLVPQAGRRLFWLHNDAQYLRKPRNVWPLLRWRPTCVFLSDWHATTCPPWIPEARRVTIPLGVRDRFFGHPRQAPPARALYAGHPERGLDDLLRLWPQVLEAVPNAQLEVYSGAFYGDANDARTQAHAEALRAQAGDGVRLNQPVGPAALQAEMAACRLLAYPGGPPESFCLTVAEAQAMGLPAVVRPRGALGERVADGETGFAVQDDAGYVAACVRLLRDDDLWGRMSKAARLRARALDWDAVAQRFEALADA